MSHTRTLVRAGTVGAASTALAVAAGALVAIPGTAHAAVPQYWDLAQGLEAVRITERTAGQVVVTPRWDGRFVRQGVSRGVYPGGIDGGHVQTWSVGQDRVQSVTGIAMVGPAGASLPMESVADPLVSVGAVHFLFTPFAAYRVQGGVWGSIDSDLRDPALLQPVGQRLVALSSPSRGGEAHLLGATSSEDVQMAANVVALVVNGDRIWMQAAPPSGGGSQGAWSVRSLASGTTTTLGQFGDAQRAVALGDGVLIRGTNRLRGTELWTIGTTPVPSTADPQGLVGLRTNHDDVNSDARVVPELRISEALAGRVYYTVSTRTGSVLRWTDGTGGVVGNADTDHRVAALAADTHLDEQLTPRALVGARVVVGLASGGRTRLHVADAAAGTVTALGDVEVRSRPVAAPDGRSAWFVGHTAAHGQELWRTDGTPGGTRRITDLHAGSADGVLPEGLLVVAGGQVVVQRPSSSAAVEAPDLVVVRPRRDSAVTGVKVTAKARQKQPRTAAKVVLKVRAGEAAKARASGTVTVPGRKRVKLRGVSVTLTAGRTKSVRVAVPASAKAKVRKAVLKYRSASGARKARLKVVATVTVRLVDARGNATTRTVRVRLV